MACRWFSLDTPVSYSNKADRHDITEILLKVALNTLTLTQISVIQLDLFYMPQYKYKSVVKYMFAVISGDMGKLTQQLTNNLFNS